MGGVVGVGGREAHGQGDAVPIHDQVVFGAGVPRSVGFGPVCSPPFCPHADAVRTGPAPVDRDPILHPVQEPFVEELPESGGLPVTPAAPTGRAAAAVGFHWRHLPSDVGLEDEDDTGEGGAVRYPRSTARGLRRLFRQQRFDGLSEIVRDKAIVLHGPDDSMPAGGLLRVDT